MSDEADECLCPDGLQAHLIWCPQATMDDLDALAPAVFDTPTLTARPDGTLECSAGCPFVIWPEDKAHHLEWHVEQARPVSERYS